MSSPTIPSTIRLPMEVEYQPSWLTWVASATTCLRALGVDCDKADVAGFSGYAFHFGVHDELCPSGPTALDWSGLSRGIHQLGRATTEFRSSHFDETGDAHREASRSAFELIRAEITAGRPCVLWGTYLPEFGVVVGIEGEAYRVKSFKGVLGEEQPPIPHDATASAGGIYALTFPAPAEFAELQRDLETILEALARWRRPAYGRYRYGAGGYDLWIEALEARRAARFGCGYNAACYAEGRHLAQRFFERMATRRPLAGELLQQCATAYGEAAAAMDRLCEILPFRADVEGPVTDTQEIDGAASLLAVAREAETRAMDRLEEITEMPARAPQT